MPIIIEGPDGAGKSTNDTYRRLCGEISVRGHDAAGTEELLDSGFTPLDIEKFSAHISEIERIAMSSDEPKLDITVYRLDNDIVMEVNDED